ncbi:MAG: hypothetical protein V3U78_07455 [Thiotrichaceae bacterium]
MTTTHNRELIASEAARLLYEEGYRDYFLAKQKAAQRLGCLTDKASQPSNQEVHNALIQRRQTLATEKENLHLVEIRQVTIEAMEFLHPYSPALVGSVMDGTAGVHSPATLHLFANTAEEVMFFLEDNKIPFQTHEQSFRLRGKQEAYPLLRFYADDYEIELIVFEMGSPAPLSSVTGKAMKRLSIDGVRELTQSSTE